MINRSKFRARTFSIALLAGAVTAVFGSGSGALAQTMTASPTPTHPGLPLQVSGKGFSAKEGVDVYFDATDELLGVTNTSGVLPAYSITVPASALPGKHWITAIGRKTGDAAQVAVTLRTDWHELGGGAQSKHVNQFENVINTQNVGQLDVAWRAPLANVDTTPAVVAGIVYVSVYGGTVQAFNAKTGAKIWSFNAHGTFMYSSPAVFNSKVYFGSTDGNIYCLNAATGALVWSTPTGNGIYSSPLVVGSTVYIGSYDQKLYAVNANTGAILWTATTGNAIFSSPASANGMIYVGSLDGSLYAFSAATGVKVWSYATAGAVVASPAIAGGAVFIASEDKTVTALDPLTGSVLWSTTVNNAVDGSPATANGKVYVGTISGTVYALEAGTGAIAWANTVNSSRVIAAGPLFANGIIFVGSAGGAVYALSASNGELLWSAPVVYDNPGGLTVADGTVYVPTDKGQLYAFQLGAGDNLVARRDTRPPSFATLAAHINRNLKPAPVDTSKPPLNPE
jgi:outer membrane protein assembly factor BamB